MNLFTMRQALEKGYKEAEIVAMLNAGELRRQGACYYRTDGPTPWLEEIMLVEVTSVTAEELREIRPRVLMEILAPHLSLRKKKVLDECMGMSHDNALISLMDAYQSVRDWGWVVQALNDARFE